MTRKIFSSTIIVVNITLILCLSIIMGIMCKCFSDSGKKQIDRELALIVKGIELNGLEYLSDIECDGINIEYIDFEGKVIYSSGNESDKWFSCEQRLTDGGIIRLSYSSLRVMTPFVKTIIPVVVVFLAAVLISALLIKRLAGKIVEPLNEINLDKPLENEEAYEELAPLLGKINKQRKQLKKQDDVLKRKMDEFEQILNYMNEGLVLLNEKCEIVSINPAAQKFFNVSENCVGEDFLMVDRSPRVSKAVENALKGQNSEFTIQKEGCEFQINISKIELEKKILGVVVLVFDVTEQAFARRNRQEFTASISHELKTPVQSIVGSAELLQSGLVKTEDIPRFVGHIHAEASRLVTLINDIIRLSQIDEGMEVKKEYVDLCQVAREVVNSLQKFAESRNVSLQLDAGGAVVEGVRHYVYEIIYNVCDNAIRYNKENGSVYIIAGQKDGKGYIRVEDTGIGIPLEHRSRVFERFYRVDKSHSKETGGTGLGLSIVKNAAKYLGASVSLVSEVDKGTTIEIVF